MRRDQAIVARCGGVRGHADGTVALWSFDPAHLPDMATRDSTIPSMEIDTEGPEPITVLSGDRP